VLAAEKPDVFNAYQQTQGEKLEGDDGREKGDDGREICRPVPWSRAGTRAL
jgi:hypothetical protein